MRKKVLINKRFQKRTLELKTLAEQRADHLRELTEMTEEAKAEERALSEEEEKKFNVLEKKIQSIDSTIKKMEHTRNLSLNITSNTGHDEPKKEELEERAFENYIRKEMHMPLLETRAGEQNITMGNNGAVVPSTIANRIIEKVKDICPIFSKATMYSVKGTLKVPVWGLANNTHDIKVSYQEEFSELTADSGKFTSIDLGGFLAGALVLIGKSVVNNASVDVVSFIIGEMAKQIANFLEKELLIGTSNKATGALDTTTTITASTATSVTADELIELQAQVKQAYQSSACWTLHPNTFLSIKKLKDANGRYILQDDFTGEFSYRLLGKPVCLSDNMPTMAAGNKAILYGDYSGLSVNMRENVEIQILIEKYATLHAIGVVAWFEFDSKVTDNQKLATLKMKEA